MCYESGENWVASVHRSKLDNADSHVQGTIASENKLEKQIEKKIYLQNSK